MPVPVRNSSEPLEEGRATAVNRVMVVDDSAAQRKVVAMSLLRQGFEVIEAVSGDEALDIIRRHAFPNAIAPIVNVVMLNLAFLVVGVVVVEVIFVYPGMGQYLVDHVAKRDVPVVQAVGLVFAAVYISLNIIADIAAILANPRLRHPK